MALDEQAEEAAYKAVNDVAKLIWPKQRERIMKNILVAIMVYMNWSEVRLEKDNEVHTKTD